MRIRYIVNPASGSAQEAGEFLEALRSHESRECVETSGPGDAVQLAREAVEAGVDAVVAVGGDGTVQEVANGIMQADGEARLGLVPLGTGNDLARTLEIPVDPEEAIRIVEASRTRPLDLIEVRTQDETFFGVNAAAGGFGGEVADSIQKQSKSTWGPFVYLLGAAKALPRVQDYTAHVTVDGGEPEELHLHLLIVANGRTAGGGREMAPDADPGDGKLDLVLVRSANLAEKAEIAANLLAGTFLEDPRVTHRLVERVEVRSDPPLCFSVDGELLTDDPVTFSVRPAGLQVLVA